MAIKSQSTGFSTYNPRRLERTTFTGFTSVGIDRFTNILSMSPEGFLSLDNIIPSSDGSFDRRWGLAVRTTPAWTDATQRLFSYAAKADTTNPGTVDSYGIFAAHGNKLDLDWAEAGPFPFNSLTFPTANDIYAVVSRGYLYASDSSARGKKLNPSQAGHDTAEKWGIITPTPGGWIGGSGIGGISEGVSSATISIIGGGGAGATGTVTIGSGGVITGAGLTALGSGYVTEPIVTIANVGGTVTGRIRAVIGTDSTSVYYQKVVSLVMEGTITLNAGRMYAIAFKNSETGHVSDFATGLMVGYNLFSDSSNTYTQSVGTLPVFMSFQIPDSDPQVDQVVLLATADGGDLSTLYEVHTFDLTDFTLAAGTYSLTYYDHLPDTFNGTSGVTDTLLAQNIWVEPDGLGGTVGIDGNTPPLDGLTKYILHKGRFFGTDGKSLYFSKSLAEVTTSTGLITSKWEEAWPGDYLFDVAYGDELIVGLISDGDILYIGTTKNIYRLLGDSPSNFALPATIFRGVGVLSQDCWSVFYKDDVPAGYTWVTPDRKIMLSDFNSYTEIGKYIYPLLGGATPVQVQSVSYGPYSLAIYSLNTTNSWKYFIYDTKEGGWYSWTRDLSSMGGGFFTLNSQPILSYTDSSGISRIYTGAFLHKGATDASFLVYFEPTQFFDAALGSVLTQNTINYDIRTGWLDMGDSTAFKVINDMEVWSLDVPLQVSAYGLSHLDSFGSEVLLKTGSLVTGPMGMKKFYLAGTDTANRYFSFRFFSTVPIATSPITTNPVLQQFNVEHFPQVRI